MLPRGAPQAGRVTIGIVSDVKLALAAALGTACRALGLRVSCDEDFLPALQEALQANRPALIEVMTELEFISPTATLSQVSASQPGR
jgi:thiamine pyrophosphate-dependent acetolactate synthase large subunit-like protein